MAGDWIKVEKSTPEKPEVLALAELLGIHPDEAFGKCFRFWRWADSNLVDGTVKLVTKASIDNVLGCSGFADALVKVGWLTARKGSLVIPNFERHTSESAKQRALTAIRVAAHKAKHGNAEVTPDALPRREEDERKTRGRKEIPNRDRTDRPIGARAREDPSAASPNSRIDISCSGGGEPLDLSGVDWSHVEAMAEAVGKRVPPSSAEDRRAWFRYAVMAALKFSEAWLVGAAEHAQRTRQQNGTTKSKQAHFVATLKSSAAEPPWAVDGETFDGIARRIEIPDVVWKSEINPLARRTGK